MYFEQEPLRPEIYQPAADLFQDYQITHEFYQEVQSRETFAQHCQWYAETVQYHQQELEIMRGEMNVLGWFLGKKSSGSSGAPEQ